MRGAVQEEEEERLDGLYSCLREINKKITVGYS